MKPLVVATSDLPRAPGSTRALTLEVPAPADLAIAVIGVPEGSAMHIELVLTSAHDGILVAGTATVELSGECVRCLDPIHTRSTIDLAELYLYPEAAERAAEDGDDEALELFRTDGHELDLEPMIRDALVMSLPFRPLCAPGCPGLCPVCGARLAEAPGHRHDVVDPRWRVLEGFLEQDEAP